MRPIRLGVTGTDTGVGKTRVAAGLLAAWRARGLRVAGMKPVETGVAGGVPPHGQHAVRAPADPHHPDAPDDATLLGEAAGGHLALERVRPLAYAEPLAPLLAARRAGAPVDLAVLDAAWQALRAAHDVVVVEGAGGLLAPIADGVAFRDLCVRWRLALVVVAANRLGAVSHARLTVEAARVAGLHVRALVLVDVTPTDDADVARATNPALLRELLPDVPVHTFPFVAAPHDVAALARAACDAGLEALLRDAAPVPSHST